MIAFDIDGVLLPDSLCLNKTFEAIREISSRHFKPLHLPEYPFYLITGRPVEDYEHTSRWIDTFFSKNRPVKLFHGNSDPHKSKEYKLQVLLENPDITTFIESDDDTVIYLRDSLPSHWKGQVIPYSIMVLYTIERLDALHRKETDEH